MSGFDENPFGEPTVDNPFAVSCKRLYNKLLRFIILVSDTFLFRRKFITIFCVEFFLQDYSN